LAESLRDLLERTEHDEAGVVTASFGVAPYEEGLDADGWVRRADEALYGAKRSGRNRVVLWTPEAEGILDEKPGS
jgi:diguanylate cyclase (GGDEF)-like protein